MEMRRLIGISSFFLSFFFFPSEISAQAVINEFQLSPSSDQWIELYNRGDSSVDISSWIVDDAGGTERYVIASGTTLFSRKCISFTSGK
ncbi:MAG: lamin tail domain-containing protein, partial [Patescibacteria group bacterium]